MLKFSLLALLLVSVIQLNAKLTLLPIQGTDISAGAGGSVWVVGELKVPGTDNIYRKSPCSAVFKKVPGATGTKIAASPDGGAWIVNDKNQILRYSKGKWETIPGKATDIAVGGDGSVWIIGTNKVTGGWCISKWNEAKKIWQTVSGGAVRISVTLDGVAWIVNNKGRAYFWNAGKWKAFGSTSIKGADVGTGLGAYLVSTKKVTGGSQVYQANSNNWVAINDEGKAIGAIAVTADKRQNLYLIDETHQVLLLRNTN